MKIEPVKNYRKPNYAMRFASIITAAGSLAGCNSMQLEGDTSIIETDPATTDVEFVGEVEPATDETDVELDGDVICEPAETEVFIDGDVVFIEDETTTEPAVTTAQDKNIAVPGIVIVETEETSPIANNRKKQTYTTSVPAKTIKIADAVTAAAEETTIETTETAFDGTVPMYTQTTATEELVTAGVAPIYTETTTTTEPELAGDVMIEGEFLPYME